MSASDSVVDLAGAVDGARLDQHVLRLATVRAGVHAQGAADGAGNAAIEGETGDAGVGGGARHLHVGDGRAGTNAIARLGRDRGKALAQANDDARHAALAHQKVGAEADDGDGKVGGNAGEKVGEVGFIGRREQGLRRAADAEPGYVGELGSGRKAAAQIRQLGLQVGADIGKRQRAPPSLRDSAN